MAIALVFQLAALPLIAGSSDAAPQSPAEVDTALGRMRISGDFAKSWNLSAKCHTAEKGVQEITVSIESNRGESLPPQLCISWSIPQRDIQYRWHASKGCGAIPADWGQPLYSSLSGNSPILALMGNDGNNRLTFACSEAKRRVAFKAGVHEETNEIFCEIRLFSQRESPLKNYSAAIRLDTREIPYCDAIGAAARWLGKLPGNNPLPVPETAREPFYSTWYSYHHNVFAGELEKECELAAQYGMKGIILDGGWYADDGKRGCDFWGDGKASKLRFPDMRAHVENVHKLGMKYMVWFGVPFIGYSSEAYGRFKGKYLNDVKNLDCASLDPRFPEVREYLIETCERILKEWDIDGFKFDFIDMFRWNGEDPAIAENYAGRDIKNLPLAVDFLLSSMTERLSKIKKDLLIEFRQPYIGPSIRNYGNMFRVTDCPGDALTNRLGTANLRLASGTAAVHSDMLTWRADTPAEDAARQLLATLFAVPQISVRLEGLPPDHRKMLKFYLGFMAEHRDVLQNGKFLPLSPEQNYPQIRAEKGDRAVIAVYGARQVADLPEGKICHVFNATAESALAIDSPSEFYAETFNALGESVGEKRKYPAGLSRIAVPISGCAKLKPIRAEDARKVSHAGGMGGKY